MKSTPAAIAVLLLTGTMAIGHRLDEYLQAAIISIGTDRVHAELTLTPGVAVFPALVGAIDTDGNGIITPVEQQAYVTDSR
jgi:hypothetical protein